MKTPSKNYGHGRVDSFVYGPVKSRRYGTTLGINLLPANDKLCNFDCIYCQLGWNEAKPISFPETNIILSELESWIAKHTLQGIDAIVFSGNGEPTLHPNFNSLVEQITDLLRQSPYRPKMICFTNGTFALNATTLAALQKFDEVALKFDPESRRVNLPDASSKYVLYTDFWFKQVNTLANLTLQCCLFGGPASNSHETAVRDWLEQLKHIHALRMDLYTIERSTPKPDLVPLSDAEMQRIASQIAKHVAFPIAIHVNANSVE